MLDDSKKKEILDFWENLSRFNVQILTHAHIIYKEGVPPTYAGPINFKIPEKFSSREFHAFSMNISRIMHLYQELFREPPIKHNISIQVSTPYDNILIALKDTVIAESIIVLLISTIEVYLEDTFKKIANYLPLGALNKKIIKKFFYIFHIKVKLRKIKRKLSADSLSSILPERMDFQNSYNSKIAFKLINIEIPLLDNSLWEYIFAKKKESSLISQRNTIIHALTRSIERLNINHETIKEHIEKTCELVFNIEKKKIKLYPNIRPDIYFFE